MVTPPPYPTAVDLDPISICELNKGFESGLYFLYPYTGGIAMSALRQKMIEDMQLRGLSERTQDSYVRAVRQFLEYCHKPAEQVGQEEFRQYFLYLKNIRHVSRSTCTLALCGLKFFSRRTSGRCMSTLWKKTAGRPECTGSAAHPVLRRAPALSSLPDLDLFLWTAPVGRRAFATERRSYFADQGYRWRAQDAACPSW